MHIHIYIYIYMCKHSKVRMTRLAEREKDDSTIIIIISLYVCK